MLTISSRVVSDEDLPSGDFDVGSSQLDKHFGVEVGCSDSSDREEEREERERTCRRCRSRLTSYSEVDL